MPLNAVPRPPLRLLRPSPRPVVASACCPVCSPQPVGETAVGQAFTTFLRLEVAQGAAALDTQRGYWSQVRAWAAWCQAQACCLATAPATAVKTYRQALVEAGYQPASIAHKLAVLRRFYAAALAQGLRADNPALGVHPPRDRRAAELLPYLAEGELVGLLQAVPRTETGPALRDRVLLALLGVQGLRTVEVVRANVEDLYDGDPVVLRVRGKTRDRLLPLRPDLAAVLQAYLAARGAVRRDAAGTPLLTAVGNRAGGRRLSCRGLRYVVDRYLGQAGLKRPGVSDHALRHTAATLAYKYTRDLRAVQHMLGHADPRTTARYAHLVERLQQNPALAVPVGV
jgi:site-specific recombinase XerD